MYDVVFVVLAMYNASGIEAVVEGISIPIAIVEHRLDMLTNISVVELTKIAFVVPDGTSGIIVPFVVLRYRVDINVAVATLLHTFQLYNIGDNDQAHPLVTIFLLCMASMEVPLAPASVFQEQVEDIRQAIPIGRKAPYFIVVLIGSKAYIVLLEHDNQARLRYEIRTLNNKKGNATKEKLHNGFVETGF